jgi:hypothetical protein
VSRLGLPVSHSGQNVIQLNVEKGKDDQRASSSFFRPSPVTSPQEKRKHVPAIEFSCAEHDDPIMPRGVALHDLVYDERGEGPGAKHGQQLERDDRGVCRTPARVGSGVFAPCAS